MSERSEIHVVNYIIISAVRTVSRGHKLVADGWALFERHAQRWGRGNSTAAAVRETSDYPHPPPTTPVKMEEEEAMDQSTSEEKQCMRSQSTLRRGENIVLQVSQLRHHPQEVQNGYGLPYPFCPHEEASLVLLLPIYYI